MLNTHIFHLDRGKGAEFQRFGKDPSGIVCVYVDLDNFLIVYKNNTVAHRHDKFPKLVGGSFAAQSFFFINNTFSTIGEGNIFAFKGGKIRLFPSRSALCFVCVRHRSPHRHPFKRSKHSRKNRNKSPASGIYNARAL